MNDNKDNSSTPTPTNNTSTNDQTNSHNNYTGHPQLHESLSSNGHAVGSSGTLIRPTRHHSISGPPQSQFNTLPIHSFQQQTGLTQQQQYSQFQPNQFSQQSNFNFIPQSIQSSSHYFRPISTQHYSQPGGGGSRSSSQRQHRHELDFDLTSDSDAISSPTSSILGPPPQLNLPPLIHSLGNLVRNNSGLISSRQSGSSIGSGHQDRINIERQVVATNGGYNDLLIGPGGGPGGGGGQGWPPLLPPPIFSPPSAPGSSAPRFDESSFLGTSDACSSPETGSLPRSSVKLKRKRPPRPPPRRLDFLPTTNDDDDRRNTGGSGLEDDDDDGHHHRSYRHLVQGGGGGGAGRCMVDYGSWPRDSPSPAPSSAGYHQQQQLASVMTMSMANGLELQQDKTTVLALSEIRTQLQELTKSVESCQDEVTEVKRDLITIRSDVNLVHHVKDELDELRDCVDRIDELSRTRKTRLLEQGLTFFLSFAIFSAVLGMLQFGYNTGVVNAPKEEIEKFMLEVHRERFANTDEYEELNVQFLYSVVVSIFAIGGMLGGFGGGIIANKFGRKGGLLLNNLLGITGGFLMWLTMTFRSFELLILGRFIIGVHCGTNTILVPMYVSEIAPLNLRGALGTVNQLAVTIGLLISQILGIQQLLGTPDGWPTLLGLAIIPAVLQLCLLPLCPESPRYLLITKQREEDARRALRQLRSTQNIEPDIEEMFAESRAQQSEATISMLQLLRSSTLRAPLCIAIVMQLSQQLSGINAVLYYSTDFFRKAGLESSQAKFATIGIGSIMVGMTLISIMLIDKAGRRTLHLYGLGGMFVFSLFITIATLCKDFFSLFKEILDWISYLVVIFTLAFVVFFAVGPGSIPWMITAELFSQGPRHSAMAIAALTNWFSNWLVSILFPQMHDNLSSYVFLPFSVLLAIFWTFTYRKVPETKNKTFEEISMLFKKKIKRVGSDDSHIYGRMLNNCVTGPAEHSALIHQEEKSQPIDSLSGHSTPRPPGSLSPPVGILPPPPVPFQIPPYPQRYLDDNGV